MDYNILIKALEYVKQKFPDFVVRTIYATETKDLSNRLSELKVPYETGDIMITIIKPDSIDISDDMIDITVDKDTGEIIEIYDWYVGIPKSN